MACRRCGQNAGPQCRAGLSLSAPRVRNPEKRSATPPAQDGGTLTTTVSCKHREMNSAQRLAHSHLAAAVMVVPAVIHKGHASIDRRAHDPNLLSSPGTPIW